MEDGLEGLRVEVGRLLRKKQIIQKSNKGIHQSYSCGGEEQGQIEKYLDNQGGTKLESALVVKKALMNKTK